MPAMTVSPEYNDEGQLMDFHVSSGNKGGSVDATIVEDSQGQQHYQYVVENQDPDANSFNKDDYAQLLLDSTPNMKDMLGFAQLEGNGLPDGFADEWNELIESEGDAFNLDRLHQMLEMLTEAYNESGLREPTIDEWFDQLPQEEVDSAMNHIVESTVTYEQAEALTELHGQFEPGSAEDFIIRAGVDLAYQKADAQQLMEQAVKQFGAAQAYKAYTNLQTILN